MLIHFFKVHLNASFHLGPHETLNVFYDYLCDIEKILLDKGLYQLLQKWLTQM